MTLTYKTGKLFGQPATSVFIDTPQYADSIVIQPEPDTTDGPAYAVYTNQGYGLEYVNTYYGTPEQTINQYLTETH